MADKRPVIIVEYGPLWPVWFSEERGRILGAIGGQIVAVEHIGSTAVPGLGAKPIIDILVGIGRLTEAPACIDPLRSIGYEYFPGHEVEIPERRYFNKGPPHHRACHLHMVEVEGELWKRHLLFRDHLLTHRDAADSMIN